MRWRRAFLKIVDPAAAYLQSQDPDPTRGPLLRGGAVFGPDVVGGVRQASPEELEEIRARHQMNRAQDASRHTAGDIEPAALHGAVRELVRHGETTLRQGSVTLTARVVTFWRGDALLDIRLTGPGFGRSHLSRVSRQRSSEDERVFVECLRQVLSVT